jgi:hypothetical protein
VRPSRQRSLPVLDQGGPGHAVRRGILRVLAVRLLLVLLHLKSFKTPFY